MKGTDRPGPRSRTNAQALEAADDVVRFPAGLLDRLEVREPIHQRRERDLELVEEPRWKPNYVIRGLQGLVVRP